MSLAAELAALFHRDLTRLIQQLEAFPEDEDLWRVQDGIANSAGNLVLHLEGNLGQYVGRAVGGIPFARDRNHEFAATGLTADLLVERIGHTRELVVSVVTGLSDEALAMRFPEDVLGVPMTTRQFLIHLHGHLNYHLGQIDYLRRILTGVGAIQLEAIQPQE